MIILMRTPVFHDAVVDEKHHSEEILMGEPRYGDVEYTYFRWCRIFR